jgi:phospholipid/cholesterol/gamma-HCH transport system substrate-binding protein
VPVNRASRTASVLLAVTLIAGGCSLRTAGSPKGDLELTAVFEDVANLVVGHSVQVADVAVGTVTAIDLVDHRRARVTMSIEDHVSLPVGTSAALAKTSLLGEQYIELRPPNPGTPVVGGGQELASGDVIGETLVTADFETVTERAIEFLGAVGAEDVATVVSTGADAFGGRGEDLNVLLRDLTSVVTDLDGQRLEIARTIDGFARLSRDLARGDDQVLTLVGDLSDASATLARNRERVIGALRGIRDMTRVTNQAVLAEHTDELVSTIQDLDPILATLAGQRPLLEEMLTSVNGFLRVIADNLVESSTPAQAQFIWTKGLATPSGTFGEGDPPVPSGPPAPLPAPPDATSVSNAAGHALDTLLGLLGDPDTRLPLRLCRRLRTLGVDLDLRLVCGARPGGAGGPDSPLPVPLPDPAGTVDDVLGGLGG